MDAIEVVIAGYMRQMDWAGRHLYWGKVCINNMCTDTLKEGVMLLMSPDELIDGKATGIDPLVVIPLPPSDRKRHHQLTMYDFFAPKKQRM